MMKLYLNLIVIILGCLTGTANAGTFELGGTFSYSSSSYGPGSYQWSRRWSLNFGYQFWGVSEIEISYHDVFYRTKFNSGEDTTFHDQVFSLNWVQGLASKSSWIQPYVKVGVGQLNREASGTYSDGSVPPAVYASLTAIVGAGLRIFLNHSIALKGEAVSYLTYGDWSSWQNNFSVNGGVSFYF